MRRRDANVVIVKIQEKRNKKSKRGKDLGKKKQKK